MMAERIHGRMIIFTAPLWYYSGVVKRIDFLVYNAADISIYILQN